MRATQKSFLIGFDRYVQLPWCAASLEVARDRKTLSEIGEEIAVVLHGAESRRKTIDILKRLWLMPLPHCTDFVQRGVELYQELGEESVLPLSWGCAMATYPFFGKTAEITGRLLAIQGDCSIKEIQRRMAEVYGDRSGVTRAVSRVLQSQESWGALERLDKGKRVIRLAPMTINNDKLTTWMIEAAVRYTAKPISVSNLQSLPVLFPFTFSVPLAYVLSNSPNLELRSEGPSNQSVDLYYK